MSNAVTVWEGAQQRARIPGSAVLNAWRAEREQARAIKNVTYSQEVYDSFGMLNAASGVSVTPTSAMRVSAVFACVQRIAGGISTLPLNHYTRQGRFRDEVENSPFWFLLNESPTSRFTAAAMWELVVANMLLRGDAFIFIGRDTFGNVKELIPLPWGSVRVERDQTATTDRLKYYVNDLGRIYGAEAEDMLHIPGFGFNGLHGMSVIQWAAQNAAGTAMAMDQYAGQFFAGGAHPSIVIETAGKMSTEGIKSLQAAFVSKYSGMDNAHKLPLVLTEGLKANQLSLNADDAQLLEARKFQVLDIARAFGVPPHLIGETSGSTSWGSGIESMSRGFVTYTLQPHLVRIEQELNRKLFRTLKNFVEFDRDALIEGDSKAQADYNRAALGGPGTGQGWMTVDEIRARKNMKPMGGTASEIFDPAAQQQKQLDAQAAAADKAAAAPKAPDPAANAMAGMVAALGVLATREQAPNVVNVAAPVIEMRAGDTQVNLPEGCIQLEAHIEQPDVNVEVAPTTVNATLQVQQPKAGTRVVTAKRDENGKLVATVVEDQPTPVVTTYISDSNGIRKE